MRHFLRGAGEANGIGWVAGWEWGGYRVGLGPPSAAPLAPVGLAGGGGSKRPGTLSASSLSTGPPGPLLLAPDSLIPCI